MGGRAGCEVLIWRHFDRAMDEKCSNAKEEVAHRGVRFVRAPVGTYVHTIQRRTIYYVRVRWAISLAKERTAVLNAVGGEGCRERAPVGKRLQPVLV